MQIFSLFIELNYYQLVTLSMLMKIGGGMHAQN
jgi:hypothetical protein